MRGCALVCVCLGIYILMQLVKIMVYLSLTHILFDDLYQTINKHFARLFSIWPDTRRVLASLFAITHIASVSKWRSTPYSFSKFRSRRGTRQRERTF